MPRTRSSCPCFTAHHDDKGDVDADGEVRHRVHVGGRQLDELKRLDPALTPSPAEGDHRTLHDGAHPRHKPAVHSRAAHQCSTQQQ